MIDGKKKTFNFGSNVSKTFVEGASIQKRNNYLKRHSVNEDWNEINAGSLSAAFTGSKSPSGLFQRVYFGVIVMILKKI
jgi:hypothetical protein